MNKYGPIAEEVKKAYYEDLKRWSNKNKQIKIREIAIQTLEDILGWRKVNMPNGSTASRVIQYMEGRAEEALEKIAYLDTQEASKEKNMEIDNIREADKQLDQTIESLKEKYDIREFDKQLDQTIESLKANYYNYKLYVACKKELEAAGFIIIEPDDVTTYPKVVKEY